MRFGKTRDEIESTTKYVLANRYFVVKINILKTIGIENDE